MRCPYANCDFEGTDREVDDHRTQPGIHDDQPQAGGNLR